MPPRPAPRLLGLNLIPACSIDNDQPTYLFTSHNPPPPPSTRLGGRDHQAVGPPRPRLPAQLRQHRLAAPAGGVRFEQSQQRQWRQRQQRQEVCLQSGVGVGFSLSLGWLASSVRLCISPRHLASSRHTREKKTKKNTRTHKHSGGAAYYHQPHQPGQHVAVNSVVLHPNQAALIVGDQDGRVR